MQEGAVSVGRLRGRQQCKNTYGPANETSLVSHPMRTQVMEDEPDLWRDVDPDWRLACEKHYIDFHYSGDAETPTFQASGDDGA